MDAAIRLGERDHVAKRIDLAANPGTAAATRALLIKAASQAILGGLVSQADPATKAILNQTLLKFQQSLTASASCR